MIETLEGLSIDILHPGLHYWEANAGLRWLLNHSTLHSHKGVVLDVGANAGGVGLYAIAQGFQQCILVEPLNCDRLRLNVERNGMTRNCTVVPYAVWDKDGEQLQLLERGDVGIVAGPEGGGISVPTIAFSTLLGICPEIDYLKIDVEGSEFQFLGPHHLYPDLLHRKVRFIDIEFHPQGWFAGQVTPPWAIGIEDTPEQSKGHRLAGVVYGHILNAGFIPTHPEYGWYRESHPDGHEGHVLLHREGERVFR